MATREQQQARFIARWRHVDWSLSNARWRHVDWSLSNARWRHVDWSLSNVAIAAEMNCTRQYVMYVRTKLGIAKWRGVSPARKAIYDQIRRRNENIVRLIADGATLPDLRSATGLSVYTLYRIAKQAGVRSQPQEKPDRWATVDWTKPVRQIMAETGAPMQSVYGAMHRHGIWRKGRRKAEQEATA